MPSTISHAFFFPLIVPYDFENSKLKILKIINIFEKGDGVSHQLRLAEAGLFVIQLFELDIGDRYPIRGRGYFRFDFFRVVHCLVGEQC